MTRKRKGSMAVIVLLSAALLTGCREEEKGNAFLEEGNYQEAIQMYEKTVTDKTGGAAGEKNKRLYAHMGEAYLALEDYENALRCFEQAQALCEETIPAELYLYQGLSLEKLERFEESAGAYESYLACVDFAEEENKNLVFAYNELGLCYMKLENYEQALEALVAGLELEPKEAGHRQNLLKNKVIALEYLSRFEEAYTECAAYVQNYPEDEEMLREYDFLETRQ